MHKALFICLSFLVAGLSAQHDHHQMNMDSMNMEMPMGDSSMKSMQHGNMSHAFSINLPMSRNGSGTGWLPDSTPMFGYMAHQRKWMFMFHGNVFLRYTSADAFKSGSRGSDRFDAVNWFMGMGQRRVGNRGLFRFSVMMSLDALFGGQGYPLLFQTGESWQGKPLVDRQHPHDLFSELSIAYSHALSKNVDAYIYAGYPGEPALGSVAFMHRVSSLYNPDAPITHHWNDGTHITFGVVTAGVRLGKVKLEASSFTGREPDENRYNFDMPRFDSYSGRISFNPNAYWSFQVSQGFVKSPEELNPGENVNRTTASAVLSRPLSHGHFLNVTGLWGLNHSEKMQHAFLLEGVWALQRFALFGRYEWVQKSTHELNLDGAENRIFNVSELSLGFNYDLWQSRAMRMAVGLQASVYSPSPELFSVYGRYPASGQIFLRIYPPRMMVMKPR